LAYVGTRGEYLTHNFNANQQFFGVSPSNLNLLFPNLGSVTVQDNHGNSNYNSLQAEYEHRFRGGFQFLGAYTYSKTIDDSCGNLDNCAPQLFTDYAIERGLSNQDQRYRLTLSGLYELPFGRGKRFGHEWSRPVDWAIGGWQLNGIYTLQAGLPFSVTVDGNPGATRADLIGRPHVNTNFTPGGPNPANPAAFIPYVTSSAFAVPASTSFPGGSTFNAPGTAGRDILIGPGSSNVDLAIFKNFQVTERIKVETRVQAYNLTNTPHFGNPDGDLSHGSFGQVNSTIPFSFRQVELGLRVTF
jgi:hypothetical protein